jgi:hypothetical protein
MNALAAGPDPVTTVLADARVDALKDDPATVANRRRRGDSERGDGGGGDHNRLRMYVFPFPGSRPFGACSPVR